MTDTPPNLEDGELWIPSDVFHEIISSNNIRTNSSSNVHNYTPSKSAHVPNVQPLQSWEPIPKSLFKSKSSRPKYSQGNENEYEGPTAGGAGGLGAAPLEYLRPPNPKLVAPFQYFPNPNFHNNNRTPFPMQLQQPPLPLPLLLPPLWRPKLGGMMTNNLGMRRRRGTGVFIPLSGARTLGLGNKNTQQNAGATDLVIATATCDKTPCGKINQGNQKSNVTNTNSAKRKGKKPAKI